MRISYIPIAFLLLANSCTKARVLRSLHNLDIQDVDYDPELIGLYHTDAFINLKKKYDETHDRPTSLTGVLKDMKDVLIDYCPSNNSKQLTECIATVNDYLNIDRYHKAHDQIHESIAVKDALNGMEYAIRNMNNKEDIVREIDLLKDGHLKHDTEGKMILTALSVGSESFKLWHDVFEDENHPFHFQLNHGRRRLQCCIDPVALVSSDVRGAILPFQNGEWRPWRILLSAVLTSFLTFVLGCDFVLSNPPTPGPASFPTANPSQEPSKVISPAPSMTPSKSAMPSITPSISAQPSLPPSNEPSDLSSIPPSNEPSDIASSKPSGIPSIFLSNEPSDLSSIPPSSAPTALLQPSSSPTEVISAQPSSSPTAKPTKSFSPTFSKPTLNEIITCISVIDESYEYSFNYFRNQFVMFRAFYPDRPFCLLQPGRFYDSDDFEDFTSFYPNGIDSGDGIRVPDVFYDDDLTTFAFVNRDMGDESVLSDWFELCDLEGLRSEGIGRVAFFIDESGSMTRDTVEASLALFQEKLESEGIETVAAIYNDEEEWVEPFLTNFGFEGPEPRDSMENDKDPWVNADGKPWKNVDGKP